MRPRIAVAFSAALIFLLLLAFRTSPVTPPLVALPTEVSTTSEEDPGNQTLDEHSEKTPATQTDREGDDETGAPSPTNSHAEGGLLRVVGDAAGYGPRSVLLRMLSTVPNTDRSFLEPNEWPSHAAADRWKVLYNRSLSRAVPEAYIQGSEDFTSFFNKIEEKGVLPLVTNGSALVEGPTEGKDSIKLADLRGLGDANLYFNPVKGPSSATESATFDSILKHNRFAKTVADLEFVRSVPAVHVWLRRLNDTKAKWEAKDAEIEAKTSNVSLSSRPGTVPTPVRRTHRSAVRVACLYAGFVRDYFRMFISCMDKYRSHKKCSIKCYNKLYGSQRENIVDSTGCDVFTSTWDIVGTGRYDTTVYKSVEFNIDQFKAVYGNRLAGLHIQKYNVYERVWKYMAKRARSFPQTRPVGSIKIPASWTGIPENNFFFRVNDYSQSYKHWCVVQLALLSGYQYDVFFRLRMDLRAVRSISNFRFAHIVPSSDGPGELQKAIAYDISGYKEIGGGHSNSEKAKEVSTHFIAANTLHVQNFDYADFGFMATPSAIHALASVWYYCIMPPVEGLPLQYLSPSLKPASEVISEYNLAVWRIIWENRLQIDNGGLILRISRRGEENCKGGGKGSKGSKGRR